MSQSSQTKTDKRAASHAAESRIRKRLDDKLTKQIIGIVISGILIFVLLHPKWLPIGAASAGSMQELTLDHFLIQRSTQFTVAHWLTVLLAVCVVWLVYTILVIILKAIGKKNDRAATVTNLLRGMLKYASIIAAIVWGLSILGVNTTAVLAGVGIIGLVLGFGAQSLIEDIITGFFIIFEGQYGIGDIIVLDDFRGVVRDIGVRTTVIEDAGGNLKVVNNSDIRNFQNRSRKHSLAITIVSVAYETDLMALEEMVKPELEKMYEQNKSLYLAAPEYYGVEELGESGIDLKFCVLCKEINVFAARRRLNRDIRVLFAEKGVEIPFPQVVVHKGD